MPEIPFTQLIRPTGARRAVTIERPAEVVAVADGLRALGVVFECEELSTGEVALYASDAAFPDEDLAIEVVPNGPEVPAAVDRLVRDALAMRNGDRG